MGDKKALLANHRIEILPGAVLDYFINNVNIIIVACSVNNLIFQNISIIISCLKSVRLIGSVKCRNARGSHFFRANFKHIPIRNISYKENR